ncbi:MAG TPA: helix-turn-helix transcriptional regulator [Sphingopyxis sp.]|uniref:helix-turn-helix transcriptional regulator n=1 Tax=Sphingopyxis sp. TaxID=1908224 RepID=UPI002CF26062|nr:helix-turn-helix transcriptional regulator [Sphingopyxis sp.]HWW56343.1 helix-turn-helix transcriptional regulator [Sphingopyxis sp.]
MTMQPDELKEARQEMGLTQGELAERLGVTPQFVGRMERGKQAIEPRTALAVRQLYNELTPMYDARDLEKMEGDIPLRNAMIVWDEEMSPPMLVVDNTGRGGEEYISSYGACNSDWARADTVGQLLRLLSRIPEWTLVYRIKPREVHDALWVIPEYRRAMAPDFIHRPRR